MSYAGRPTTLTLYNADGTVGTVIDAPSKSIVLGVESAEPVTMARGDDGETFLGVDRKVKPVKLHATGAIESETTIHAVGILSTDDNLAVGIDLHVNGSVDIDNLLNCLDLTVMNNASVAAIATVGQLEAADTIHSVGILSTDSNLQIGGAFISTEIIEADGGVVAAAAYCMAGGGILSPPPLPAGITNNYSPTGLGTAGIFRLTTNAGGSSLSGFDHTVVPHGPFTEYLNLGPGTLTLLSQNTGSSPTNRLALPAATKVLAVNETVRIWYDQDQRFKLF